MNKKLRALVLTLFAAITIAPSASAISGGSMSCDKLKTTFSSDSSETGAATVVLSENCKIDDIYIKDGQNITLDTSGHTLETKINVESGGKLTISSAGAPGNIAGSIKNEGEVSITGGKFTFDPSKYLADGYTTSVAGGLYVVSAKKSSSSIIDATKITSSSEDVKNALIKTLEAQVKEPNTATENGRILDQLLNAIKNGHTLSASIDIASVTEVSSALQNVILEETAGMNLGSVSNISFVVTDTSNNSSVSLTELAIPVSITLPIPEAYKAQLRERGIDIIHISGSDSDSYEANTISEVSFDTNGNLVFKTTSFSAFAMAYDGDPITATGGDTTTPGTSVAPSTVDSDVVAPDTAGFGIELTVYNLLMIIGIALVVIALIAYASKRAYIRNKISWK